jgi:hypothetical protein
MLRLVLPNAQEIFSKRLLIFLFVVIFYYLVYFGIGRLIE